MTDAQPPAPRPDDEAESPPQRPDPWAVVEHHAQRAAERAEGSMNSAQRLALYASSAPGVIGAHRMQSGEFGLTQRGPDDEWWKVSIPGRTPGTPLWMAWNSAGRVLVQRPGLTLARMLAGGGLSWMLGMVAFSRFMGPRAVLPAIVLGVGVAVLVKQLLPGWSPLGRRADDDRHRLVLEELVARYEEDVPPP